MDGNYWNVVAILRANKYSGRSIERSSLKMEGLWWVNFIELLLSILESPVATELCDTLGANLQESRRCTKKKGNEW